jgi:OmpA-OmpF porin, OOP family
MNLNYTTTKHLTFAFTAALALTALLMTSNASAAIRGSQGYVTNTEGNVVMNETGSCWHNGSWKASDAIAGCDGVPQRVAAAPQERVVAAPAAPAEKIIITADTLFDFDKSSIKPAGRSTLDNLVTKLEGNQRVVISTGFTSSPGSDDYNMKLSHRRTEAVKTYLVSKGIDGNRIYTAGKGEHDPVATNSTVEGRGLNRRVEIEVMATPAR